MYSDMGNPQGRLQPQASTLDNTEFPPDLFDLELDGSSPVDDEDRSEGELAQPQTPSIVQPVSFVGHARVLILHSGSSLDPITCTLEETSSTKPPREYEALSYEWGPPEVYGSPILINDTPTLVRENLYNALLHLRQPDRDRCLWIDALCINQSDPKERAQQVQIMGRIYSCAIRVIVWLGLSADHSDMAMKVIRTFDHPGPASKLPTLTSKILKALQALCTRGYWHRIWVVQEMRLAKEIEFHCGSKSTTGTAFQRLYEHLPILIENTLSQADTNHPKIDIWALRSLQNSIALSGHIAMKSREGRLQDWLLHCSQAEFEASEPRDMVYALLGMSCDIDENDILPDYEKNISEVFGDVLRLYDYNEEELFKTHKVRERFSLGAAMALGEKLGIDMNAVFNMYRANIGAPETSHRSESF